MATIKSYTDLEQSKKLAEILQLETADMIYLYWINTRTKQKGIDTIPTIREGLPITKCDIPCWSLTALLNILPNYQLQTQDDGIGILCSYNGKFNIITADNPIDVCYSLIIKLNEKNLL